jgi:DNA-binding transcriptional LysR family regulator
MVGASVQSLRSAFVPVTHNVQYIGKRMKGSRDSLKTLGIFQSAARTLNFSRSAEELNITQSSVSKHINALEQRLGTALFNRKAKGLELTYAGTQYFKRIVPALTLIEEANALVAPGDIREALTVAVSPSFAQYSLIPHLSQFYAEHPNIRLNIRPRLLFDSTDVEPFDAAIQLHTGSAGGLATKYLCGREMSLIVAPQLLAGRRVRDINEFNPLQLLKRAQRGYSWNEWRAEVAPHWSGPTETSPVYEGFSMLLPAVFHGLGAAVVPLCMVLDRLESGELVRPFGEVATGRYAYYLMRPSSRRYDPHIEVFSAWLMHHAAALGTRLQSYLEAG